ITAGCAAPDPRISGSDRAVLRLASNSRGVEKRPPERHHHGHLVDVAAEKRTLHSLSRRPQDSANSDIPVVPAAGFQPRADSDIAPRFLAARLLDRVPTNRAERVPAPPPAATALTAYRHAADRRCCRNGGVRCSFPVASLPALRFSR